MSYEILTYENMDGKMDGISGATKVNKDPHEVYKTLVTQQGSSKNISIPV